VGLGLVPKGSFHDLLHQLTGYDGERAVILLIGSSFSERGSTRTCCCRSARRLRTRRRGQRLAVGGAPHLERLHYLKEYLARAAVVAAGDFEQHELRLSLGQPRTGPTASGELPHLSNLLNVRVRPWSTQGNVMPKVYFGRKDEPDLIWSSATI
jgi:hypothetical protein